MTRAKASQKRRTKASQRRRRPAAARLQRDLAQAQQAAKIWEQALDAVGLPANLVAEIDGRLRSQHKLLGQLVGVLGPPSVAVAPTPHGGAGGAGTKTFPHVCSGRCPSAPGASGSAVWAWRCCYRSGATPPGQVRPRAAAGSGPGWVMTRSSKSPVSRWASWAPGGVARHTGCSPVLMAFCSSWCAARANSGCPWTVPSGGQPPQALGRRATTNCTGCKSGWMDAWRLAADAVWPCHLRSSWRRVGVVIQSSCTL
jgi:hypothetical protein